MPDPSPVQEHAQSIIALLVGAVTSLLAALGLRGKRAKGDDDDADLTQRVEANRAQADAANRRIDAVTQNCADHRSRLTGLEHDHQALDEVIRDVKASMHRLESKVDQLLLRQA